MLLKFYSLSLPLSLSMCVCVRERLYVEIRAQFGAVGSLLPLCGSYGLISSCQPWHQAHLSTSHLGSSSVV